MTLRLGAIAFCLAIAGIALATVAAILLSCGGDPGGNTTPRPSSILTPQETPLPFEDLRDGLITSLDAIGPNVCCVPPDVRRNLLERCGQLADYADRDAVTPLCDAINRSFQNNDPGLLDNVVGQLRTLEAD